MLAYTLTNLSDAALIRDLKALLQSDRATTAALLAHIAEVDARRLYAPAGYSSMFAYCVGELRLSEGGTYKRITAARAARKYPILFRLVAEGRLHLTAIKFLAPHLTPGNAGELIASAVGLSSAALEMMLGQRFGREDEPTRIGVVKAVVQKPEGLLEQAFAAASSTSSQLVARPVDPGVGPRAQAEPAGADGGEPRALSASPTATVDLAPRYRLEVTIDQATFDKLAHAQSLLSHSIRPGDVARVLEKALDALISHVEKRKVAATTARPQARARNARAVAAARRIPAGVRRAVWARDGGQCTFLGETMQRCRSRSFLEFDHVEPVARGGLATLENIRLRCRTHNQYEAERVFGARFMAEKRGGRRGPTEEAAPTSGPLISPEEEPHLVRDALG